MVKSKPLQQPIATWTVFASTTPILVTGRAHFWERCRVVVLTPRIVSSSWLCVKRSAKNTQTGGLDLRHVSVTNGAWKSGKTKGGKSKNASPWKSRSILLHNWAIVDRKRACIHSNNHTHNHHTCDAGLHSRVCCQCIWFSKEIYRCHSGTLTTYQQATKGFSWSIQILLNRTSLVILWSRRFFSGMFCGRTP